MRPAVSSGARRNARGTIITRCSLNERSIASPLIKEILALAKAKNVTDVSPAMVEGYTTAKVLVEGLRRAGKDPSGERCAPPWKAFAATTSAVWSWVTPPATHRPRFVDLSIINKDGKFTR